MYFWLVIDPAAGDEVKIVTAPSKYDALVAAATEWSYTDEDEEVWDGFMAEARITPLSDRQVETLGLIATGDPKRMVALSEAPK